MGSKLPVLAELSLRRGGWMGHANGEERILGRNKNLTPPYITAELPGHCS
jgi:hypothetical protein